MHRARSGAGGIRRSKEHLTKRVRRRHRRQSSAVPLPTMLVIAHCVSSSGLGCGHWQEFVYAGRHAWREVVMGLSLAVVIGIAAGTRYRWLLPIGVGLGGAVIIGFGAYYVSL